MIRKKISSSIPSFFYSYDTNTPFSQCSMCNKFFNDSSRYFIEKVFKQNIVLNKSEIVYEYAICELCATSMSDEISEESKISITELYEAHSENLLRKIDYLHRTEKYSIDSWVDRCSMTGKEVRLCDEYAVNGIVENGCLVYEHTPIVISDDFVQKIQEVLSKETKDTFNDFKNQITDVSPSVEDLIFSPSPSIF